MILNVEPGSITSLMTRSGSVFVLMVLRIVRVKIRQRRHRQNFARARAHDDAGDALRRVFFHRVGQGGFDDVLHRRINRQHHVQAIARLHIFVAQRDQFMFPAVRSPSRASRRAAQVCH